MDSNDLRKKLETLGKEMLQLRDKDGGKLDAADRENFDRLSGDFDEVRELLRVQERCEQVDAQIETQELDAVQRGSRNGELVRREDAAPVITEEDRSLALQAWFLDQAGAPLEMRHEIACQKTGVSASSKEIELRLPCGRGPSCERDIERMYESRALSTGTTGITLPTSMVRAFERALLFFGSMRQTSQILRTNDGNDLLWPAASDLDNTGAILGEGASIGASVDPTFTTVTLQAFKYSSKPIIVSFELLQDHPLDLAEILGTMLGERLGRITNNHFTVGDGSSKPRGLITAVVADTGSIVSSGTADTISADDLFSLVYGVDRAYRVRGSFMMNDEAIRLVRVLKDSQNQYLWQPGLQQGEPDRLLGYPLWPNSDMDSTPEASGASNDAIAFGDLSSYKIRDVASVRLRRLEERYSDIDSTAFIAFIRTDGDYVQPGSTATTPGRPVKVLRT